MPIRYYNTMSRKLEEFVPLQEGEVRLYTCGPTVHDYAHIGNFRTYLWEDLLRRHLEYRGYAVRQVMNITDIDDKTITKSIKAGVTLDEFTGKYTEAFFEDLDALNIRRAEVYPRATQHIPEMVKLVLALKDKRRLYESRGSIYFKIDTFPDYGRLSRWQGRPGWHLECSAMSMKYLGETFDIHTGGVDNIFPHHENEIAQSEGATGKPFVRYWLHSSHLIVEGEKMSKSSGNFFTLRDLREKGYEPRPIRYLLLSVHYRKQLNFTFEGLSQAQAALCRLDDLVYRLDHETIPDGEYGALTAAAATAREGMLEALDSDLNTATALGHLFDLVREANTALDAGLARSGDIAAVREVLSIFERIFGIKLGAEASLDDEVEELIRRRTEARNNRDFAESDRIRDELQRRGIILEDTPQGVRWKRQGA
jgi:cysteinyl-tRNA synthetase